MKKNAVVVAVVLILAVLAVYQNTSAREKQSPPVAARETLSESAGSEAEGPQTAAPKPGYPAPAFTLTTLDGSTVRVGGAREKPLMLNFWASWCGPCELEAPDLKAMHDKYGDRIDLYGVNLSASDKRPNAEAFVKKYGFTFPIPLDTDGSIGQAYRVFAIPTSFLINRDGVIVDVFNLLEPRDLDKRLNKLIEE